MPVKRTVNIDQHCDEVIKFGYLLLKHFVYIKQESNASITDP